MSRLKENLILVGEIGRQPDGGITRTHFSKEYFEAAAKTKEMMEQAGMMAFIDSVGNVHGILKGKDNRKGTLMIGSHLDTVKEGGLFDGAYGVIAGLECAFRLQDKKLQLEHDLEIVGFNSEETSELLGTFGSRAMMGEIDEKQTDYEKHLEAVGLTVVDVRKAKVDLTPYKGYLEIHIEQGGHLYEEKKKIGIVTGIVSIVRYRIRAVGESNHAGTTRMKSRRDALVAMSKLVCEIDRLARTYEESFVATVGVMNVLPGAMNVIPGQTETVLEMRHMDKSLIYDFVDKLKAYAQTIREVEFEFVPMSDKDCKECTPKYMEIMEQVCREKEIAYSIMPSGAGHDAKPIGNKMPMGMLFVPSVKGISHSKEEWTEWEDLDIGADVLFDTLLALDKTVD